VDPFVSVVTVSLNAAATIGDTIASIAMQERNFDVEHICVDGGSSDSTRAIIDQWAAHATHLRRVFEPDNGIFDAMNKGLRAAKGQYVIFVNADDFLVSRDTLAMAMEGLIPGADENPDLIVGPVAMGKLGCRGLWRQRRVPKLLGRLRGSGLFPVHQGLFTKRRLLEAVGGFDSSLRLASDVNLYYDLERKYRLSMRIIRWDIAFMRAGGAANGSLKAICLGTVEIYRHLAPRHGFARAAGMVFIKTMQSLTELRYGQCPHGRWFMRANDSAAKRDDASDLSAC
jgi:glycosyltransferase involved in cell wall biosynthesis